MFAALFVPVSGTAGMRAGEGGRLLDAARQCSPRIDVRAVNLVVLDLDGLERAFGDPHALGARAWQAAHEVGCAPVHVAVASTRTAAILLSVSHAGITIVPETETAAALSALPLRALAVFAPDAHQDPGSGIRDPGSGAALPKRSERATLGPSTRTIDEPRSDRCRTLVRSRNPGPALRRGSGRPERAQASRTAGSRVPDPDLLSVFSRWGLRTLGQLAALPTAQLSARVGQRGLIWQRLARGEDACPPAPVVEEERFEAVHELEWPLETLEPLSFVLGRLLEPLCQRLERRDRAAAVLTLHLRLVTREVHTRTLPLPAPMREPKVLRTLLLLDLESHPAPAGIDAVTIAIEPTPGRIIQESLLERALAAPEQISTLLARLGALMGERRCGSPQPTDSHRPGAFAMAPFRVPADARTAVPALRVGAGSRDEPERRHTEASVAGSPPVPDPALRPGSGRPERANASRTADSRLPTPDSRLPTAALRRFRLPVPARVLVDDGHPVSIRTERQGLAGGRVRAWAGPWRTSGEWWLTVPADRNAELDRLRGRSGWDRDEWDVALADGGIYRVFEDRDSGRWFVEGIVD